ncbi:MAG: VWA domain-containing protein [Pseudomonadota bacterium]|jgi:Ca-activated chloride channel family protein|nr:VWA domain-containing protein [Pseudomonadota bacterium]
MTKTRVGRNALLIAMAVTLVNCTSGPSEQELAAQQQASKEAEKAEYMKVKQERRVAAEMVMPLTVTGSRMAPMPPPVQPQYENDFEQFDANPVKRVSDEPVSTFSADVDTTSFSFVRKQLNRGYLPEKDAVRLEEMVNYFDYHYPFPTSASRPFLPTVVVHDSPWAAHRKLVHIGIQGYELEQREQPNSNLVFLLDVSGSMNAPDKLPLVKQSIKLLLKTLKPTDTIAIVVYAGAAGTVLEPTKVAQAATIIEALDKLKAGGSTAGGEGLQLAYQLAESNFDEQAVNRIMLATDGDFNVGLSDPEQLTDFVERKRQSGIYLSVIGFGRGNYKDALMQSLAQNGNGIAAYIDTLAEAQKLFVEEATSSLFPIAKDLKIQVEFNPAVVNEYRLLGYETRALQAEDFNNDKVDAGDIGSGHAVTAIYEVTLNGQPGSYLDESRYTSGNSGAANDALAELGYLKIRYKLPGEETSQLLDQPIMSAINATPAIMQEVNFATAVAGFAQLMKDGKYTGQWSLDDAFNLALANKGEDYYGYRGEFTQLIRQAKVAEEAEF